MDVLDYIKEKGNKTFFEEEFNEIDASILSLLTYIDFNKIVSTKKEPVKLKSWNIPVTSCKNTNS